MKDTFVRKRILKNLEKKIEIVTTVIQIYDLRRRASLKSRNEIKLNLLD
jgi:hypothetical protein